MAKKGATIDDLALMVQKGFNDVDERFNDVDERFNDVDERLNKVVTKKEMNGRFDKLEKIILSDHKKRIERLEDELKEIKGALALILK